MRRQLRASGGITNARQGYGIGSWVKERVRKLIPNELASVATKAAPFVAPFFPGAAAAMRGIGRFDQRGSIGDAVRQAGATYGFGKLAGKLGGAEGSGLLNPGGQTYTKGGFDAGPIGKMFAGDPSNVKIATEGAKPVGMESVSKATEFMKNIPIIGELPPLVQQQLLIGGVTSAGTYVYEKFLKEEPPQDESETMEEYMARRKENVGSKMRNYFDSYFTFDKNYSAMTDEQKDAEVARYNKNQGGLMRQNYQTGGISMTNTMAQNRAINNARRTQNQEQLQKGRDTQKATQELDSYFGKGSSTSNPNRQAFITKNFNSMPVQSSAGFNFSGATPDPFNVMSYNSKDRAGIINTISSNYAQERRNQAAKKTQYAAENTVRAEEAKRQEAAILAAYGKPEDYAFEAELLGGMSPDAYYDHLITGNPKGIAEFGEGETSPGLSPYNVYYQKESRRQKEMGMPTMEYGQVFNPFSIPSAGSQNMYSSYADAVSGLKQQYGTNPYTISGYGAPGTLADYQREFGNQGGRVGYNEGTNPKKEFLIKKGYGDMVKGMSVIEIDQLFNSVKGTFTGQGTYREPGNMGGIMRAGYAIGSPEKQLEAGAPPIMYSGNMDPNAQTGLPSIPGPMQMAEDGPEFDMRQQGGFQPLGRQEGKDDVPAMLAKNEFVMTADAVRAAGGGSIQKGAQKMYDTMKKLESRVS